jgi:hypothetical protein
MKHYVHYVSGFFAHREEADNVFTKLIGSGIPQNRVQIYASHAPAHNSAEGSNEVLKEVLVDGAIGAAVGTGIGVLVEVALVASSVTLFVASPLIAPLALLGWGASIGGLMGASIGAAKNTRSLSALIDDAIISGQIVVVAETQTDEEKIIAQEIIKDSIGDYNDVDAEKLHRL